jgi:hypothetical protein
MRPSVSWKNSRRTSTSVRRAWRSTPRWPASSRHHRDSRRAPRRVWPPSRLPAAGLRELGFNIAVEPEGAFYLYADISQFGGDAFAFCRHFLETEHVAFTPGLDFGRYQAGHHVRFAYTKPPALAGSGGTHRSRFAELARLMRFIRLWKRRG